MGEAQGMPEVAARNTGIPPTTFRRVLEEIRREGAIKLAERPAYTPPPYVPPPPAPEKPVFVPARSVEKPLADTLLTLLKNGPQHAQSLAQTLQLEADAVQGELSRMQSIGVRLLDENGHWQIDKRPMQSAHLAGALHTFYTDENHTFTFGAAGDQHYCSKYNRPEVVEELYDRYAEAGCTTVFNTGNWIDGEARFNVHDLEVRGMDAQVRHLAKVFPRRDGITTYAVAGDDHEGWYAQREGVDIGRYNEQAFRDAGRTDWVDLGYMEAPVRLVNSVSGKECIISVVHPGGGSAYALSYTMQKIVESLDGGEKPAMLLAGHYHKLWYGNVRNVWVVQTGTAEDQTPFMRKKRLEAHVGGTLCKVTMDPATGALTRCAVELFRYFNKGYYTNRWSHSGPVTLPPRAA
jgi:hypothetical protein